MGAHIDATASCFPPSHHLPIHYGQQAERKEKEEADLGDTKRAT